MANLDVRLCPQCQAVYVEDDQMYDDVNICPHCGADVTAAELEDSDE